MSTIVYLDGSVNMFDMPSDIRFGWAFIRAMLTEERLEFFVDGSDMNFQLAASGSLVRTAMVRTFIIANFIMNRFDMTNQPFTACEWL